MVVPASTVKKQSFKISDQINPQKIKKELIKNKIFKIMEQMILKQKAKKILETKGEVRGLAIKSHGEFILQKKGKEGLQKLEDEMKNLDCSIKYQKLQSMRFYPIGWETLTLLVIKQIFNFDDKKFEELGIFSAKFSLILKFFMKYIVSIKLISNQAPSIWKKYYTIGDLKIAKLDEKEKYVILRLDNFELHPLHCLHLKGYCATVVKIAVKNPVTCEETKCPFKGDNYHEFLLKW